MSMMLHPGALDPVERAEIEGCDRCEAHRRPRIYVCEYHEGWLAGRESARPTCVKCYQQVDHDFYVQSGGLCGDCLAGYGFMAAINKEVISDD